MGTLLNCFEEEEQGFDQLTLIPIVQWNISYLASEEYEIIDTIEHNLNSSSISTNNIELFIKPEQLYPPSGLLGRTWLKR